MSIPIFNYQPAWLKITTDPNTQYIPVRIIDRPNKNIALIIEQNLIHSNISYKDINQFSYTVPDQHIFARSQQKAVQSQLKCFDLLLMNMINPPEILKAITQSKQQLSLKKIGNICIVDCNSKRNLKFCKQSQLLRIMNFYRYHIQTLIGNIATHKKTIILTANNIYPHMYVFPLFSYLMSSQQLWSYHINITKLGTILSKLLGGCGLQIKIGYLTKEKIIRKTQYIHFKPLKFYTHSHFGIPSYLLDLINNQQSSINFFAPPAHKTSISNKEVKQIIECMFGVGFTAFQINKLMKYLACIANLRGIVIRQEKQKEYASYRFIDHKKYQINNKQSNECCQRFLILSGLSEIDFKNYIIFQNRGYQSQRQNNIQQISNMRLRALEYLIYEQFISYLCELLNKKFINSQNLQELSQHIMQTSRQTTVTTHKSLTIFSHFQISDNQISIHEQMQKYVQSTKIGQSLVSNMQQIYKQSLIQVLNKKHSTFQNTPNQTPVSLNQFMSISERMHIIKSIHSSKGETIDGKKQLEMQIFSLNIYKQIRNCGIMEQILNLSPSAGCQLQQIPSTIRQVLWEKIALSQYDFKNIMKKTSIYNNDNQSNVLDGCIKFEQTFQNQQIAFIINNQVLNSNDAYFQKFSEALKIYKNQKLECNGSLLQMKINQFADRYKYTVYAKQKIHRPYSTMHILTKKHKKSSKGNQKYYYTFYQNNSVTIEQFSKKIFSHFLQIGPNQYKIEPENTVSDKKNKSNLLISIKNSDFFQQLQDQVQKQELAKIKIWKQYKIFKARQKTLSIVKKNQTLKKLPKVLNKTFGKAYFYQRIKKYVICKAISKALKNKCIQQRLRFSYNQIQKQSKHKQNNLEKNLESSKTSVNKRNTSVNKPATSSPNKPNPSVNKPNTSVNKPNTSVNKPATGSPNKPNPSVNKPNTSVNKPNTSVNKPATSSPNKPNTSMNKPGSATNSTNKPQSNAGNSKKFGQSSQKNKNSGKPIAGSSMDNKKKQKVNEIDQKFVLQLSKKTQNIKQITKQQLLSLKDFPNISLQNWQNKSMIKSEVFRQIIKPIEDKHRSINILQIPHAMQQLIIQPDKQIQQCIKTNDYVIFMKKNALYDESKPKSFQSKIECSQSAISEPILKKYPIKEHPNIYKQTFNAILKIGQHKNSGKTLQFLLNSIHVHLSTSFSNQLKVNTASDIIFNNSIYNTIKDQIFLQFSKQLTNNKKSQSIIRLLHALSILSRHYSPSYTLIYSFINHLQHLKDSLTFQGKGKDPTHKPRVIFYLIIIQNLMLFVEAYERSKKAGIKVFKSNQKHKILQQNDYISYIQPRKRPFSAQQTLIGSQKSSMNKSLTPSKMDYSVFNQIQSESGSKPLQCCIRLLNNYPFVFYIRNQSIIQIKKTILSILSFQKKCQCFGIYMHKQGNLYHLIEDHQKMIDNIFNQKGQQVLLYLRIKYYFPFSIKDPNAVRLTHMNLISDEITQPWNHKDYQFLVVQSMLYGQYEQVRVSNYVYFSNQTSQKNPNMDSIKQLFKKLGDSLNDKVYSLEYMKFMKEHKMFMLHCFRKRTDSEYRIGIKPYQILIFQGVNIITSISIDRIRSVYIQSNNVVIQLDYSPSSDKKCIPTRKKYTIDNLYRLNELYNHILHYLKNRVI